MSEHLPIVLTSEDFALLQSFTEQPAEPFPGAMDVVRRKLANATVVFPADIGADVVTLNSRVRFSVNNGWVDERALVGGPSEESYCLTLPLTTPRGLALIGARVGQTVTALRGDGWVERIHIDALPYQPEAHRSQPRLRVVSQHIRADIATPGRTVRPAFFGDDDPGPSAA
jgi:regulator of nucleoside diphosphate kinase